jgi:outer membrane immunogenic protein
MRITIFLILAAGATLAGAQSAQAQSFTGPRAEVTAGYDASHNDDHVAGTPNTLDGVRIGGAIGYDVAIGRNFTIGAEAGIGFNVSGKVEETLGTTNVRLTSGRDIDLSLRLGAIVTPSTLLYVKGGYANSEYRLRTTVGGTTGPTVTHTGDDNDGYRIGAGVEQMLNEHVYAKAEYRYTDYGDNLSRHQLLAGVGYRF